MPGGALSYACLKGESALDYAAILQRVLDYVDDHLGDTLSADVLASVAGFSPYHFCRVFQWTVGHPVMEYVRQRRLAFAAAELAGGRRILDIALEYGFETHSGFSKAFRRHFGCAPETYRMHAHSARPARPSLAQTAKYVSGGIVMEPKFVSLPKIRLAGYEITTTTADGQNSKDIPAFWQAYMADGRVKTLHGAGFVTDHAEYGACFLVGPETGEMVYIIGVKAGDDADVPGGFAVRELPAATYAVFSTPPSEAANFTQNIQGVWQFIFGEWFPASGYEYMPGGVDFELYDERCMAETGRVCDVYIPVVKKG